MASMLARAHMWAIIDGIPPFHSGLPLRPFTRSIYGRYRPVLSTSLEQIRMRHSGARRRSRCRIGTTHSGRNLPQPAQQV